MIFVSQGYFKSPNCLREVRCAVTKGKPLSLVHDPVRGGASLEAIEAECPIEMRGDMFSPHRPVITFHRIKDFQMVSLRLLAEDLLLGCPNFGVQLVSSTTERPATSFGEKPMVEYTSTSASAAAAAEAKADADERADVQLALPGEITRKRLNFHTPITVYASLYNPGAAAALEMLQEGFLQLQEPTRRLTLTGTALPSFLSKRERSSCRSTLGGGGCGSVPEESFEGNCEGEGIVSEAGEVLHTSSDAAADVAAAPAMAAPAAAAPAPTRVQRMKVSATAAVVVAVCRRSLSRATVQARALSPKRARCRAPTRRLTRPRPTWRRRLRWRHPRRRRRRPRRRRATRPPCLQRAMRKQGGRVNHAAKAHGLAKVRRPLTRVRRGATRWRRAAALRRHHHHHHRRRQPQGYRG